MPDYRQVCRHGTPLPFMTVARAGKAGDKVSTEQLSLLTHFIWVFGPRPRGPFFCQRYTSLRKNTTVPPTHDIVRFPMLSFTTMFPPLLQLCFADRYERLRYRTALLLYVLVILIGDIPGVRADVGQYASGGVLHSVGYGVLALILFSGTGGSMGRRALLSILMVTAMGALDEFIQSFLPYRRGAVQDWMVDITAAVAVTLPLCFLWPKMVAAALGQARPLPEA
ncbi:VanZ family protein [Janthinobacterium sp. SUN118]|uniref:VanZ family protein n=1 Tax=Janthinobacterium sp. SUN118 TaxID=3004100 RepID=UPI0025B1F146|nr:VanZ family protein [Janthinobacterium sp. SUN118]MDN2711761.1 VanZ family protein [Janthinobacterium sp. SUN118]